MIMASNVQDVMSSGQSLDIFAEVVTEIGVWGYGKEE